MLKKSLFHILPDVLSYLISGARLDTVPVPNIKKPETCDPKSGSCSLFFIKNIPIRLKKGSGSEIFFFSLIIRYQYLLYLPNFHCIPLGRMLPQLVSAALASSLILVTLYTARLINTKLNLYRDDVCAIRLLNITWYHFFFFF